MKSLRELTKVAVISYAVGPRGGILNDMQNRASGGYKLVTVIVVYLVCWWLAGQYTWIHILLNIPQYRDTQHKQPILYRLPEHKTTAETMLPLKHIYTVFS